MMIMRVRSTLSESEIERHAILDQRLFVTHSLVVQIVSMPITMSPTLALRIASDRGEIETPTERGKVHEAGEGDSPEVRGVDYVATIDLGRNGCKMLDAWVSERGTRLRTDQETIGQPVIQEEHKSGDNGERFGPNRQRVSTRSWRNYSLDTRGFAVIDV